MTNAEILAKIRKYFIEENQPKGVGADGLCLYFSPCAIGLFLPPDLAAKIDEDAGNSDSIDGVLANYPEVAEIFKGVEVKFLCSVQEAHDADYDEDWHDGFAAELDKLVGWT